MNLRARVHAILDDADHGGGLGRVLNLALLLLILGNVAAVVLDSVAEVHARHEGAFDRFEVVSVTIFAVEYVLRLWSCTADPRYREPVRGRLRCALRPLVLIDLIAILPALLPFVHADLRTLRSLRLLRILRLLKLTRHSSALQTFGAILKSKAPELGSTLFVMLLLLVMSSSLMFVLEKDAPNTAFTSIPTAMWWGIATFTTVGYGDITPQTPGGRLLGGAVAILGIAMFAIPAGLLGAAFSAEMEKRRHKGDAP